MNAPPFRVLTIPTGYRSLPAPPECVLALLRAVGDGRADAEGLAAIAALDPVLSFELLTAAPSAPETAGFDLRAALAQRVAKLGPELIRAYCMNKLVARSAPAERASRLRHSLHGLFVAELALHLAVETQQGSFQEAYAAGLLHDIGRLWFTHHVPGHAELRAATADERALAAAELERFELSHAGVGAVLLDRCGLPASVVDAIHLHHCRHDAMADAAPLARVLWVAEEVAGSRFEVSEHDLGAAAEVSGLDASTLIDLRADVGRRLASLTQEAGIAVAGAGVGAPWLAGGGAAAEAASVPDAVLGPWGADDTLAAATLTALARGALQACDERNLAARFGPACRLLLDLDAPLWLEFDAATRQLCGVPDVQWPWAAETRVSVASASSAVAGAFRGGVSQALFGPGGPDRSAADWQLARRLGASGLLCEPWNSAGRQGVAVFGLGAAYEDDKLRSALRQGMVDGAIGVLARQRREQEARREAQQELRASYREHQRRVVHEASNPLTVMKTYLGVIRQRAPGDLVLGADLALIDNELDRVGAIVRSISLPPESPPSHDAGTVEVRGLLENLRLLYADALFGSRGIEFELQAGSGAVWARMPRDALQQVLVNLFKNAAEALGAGQRFAVSLIPAASCGGSGCLGIRLADNGPGIPPAAMKHLFTAVPSSKGGEHQGLGLVVVRETLAGHGASIVCESDARTGTTFHVYIPLADKA